MDTARFQSIIGNLTGIRTRRGVGRLLGAAAFGVGGVSLAASDQTDAKRKRKKKKKVTAGPAGSSGPQGPQGPAGPAGSFAITVRTGNAASRFDPGPFTVSAQCNEGERAIAGGVIPTSFDCTLAGSFPDSNDDRSWQTMLVCGGNPGDVFTAIPMVTCLAID